MPGWGDLSMGPLRKPLSQQNFVMNTSLYDYTLKTTIFNFQAKNTPRKLPFQNGGQITDFRFASFQFSIFKNRFPKEIFQWNLARVGNHEYINIAAIKIWYFYSGGILGAIYIYFFPHPSMLIYANYREDDRADLFFCFCIKRSVSIKVTITNNTGQTKLKNILTWHTVWNGVRVTPFSFSALFT